MADWYPANYYIQPRYKTMPAYLRLEDAFAPTLTRETDRSLWTTARDKALAQWEPVGFELRVRDAVTPYGKNRVTLNVTNDVPAEIGGWHCFEECPPCSGNGCDWIHINHQTWDNALASRDSTYLRYCIAHEFGHSLGFGHGGTGIMDATPYHARVNEEEIAAAKAYWKVP